MKRKEDNYGSKYFPDKTNYKETLVWVKGKGAVEYGLPLLNRIMFEVGGFLCQLQRRCLAAQKLVN
jgi:hypothetical protein